MDDFSKIYYRPHKAFLAEQCPSSILRNPTFIPKTKAGIRADLGSASHDAFEHYVVPNIEITDEIIGEIANKHNVDAEGFNGLGWRVRKLQKAWGKIKDQGIFNNPIPEERWSVSLNNGYEYDCIPDLG